MKSGWGRGRNDEEKMMKSSEDKEEEKKKTHHSRCEEKKKGELTILHHLPYLFSYFWRVFQPLHHFPISRKVLISFFEVHRERRGDILQPEGEERHKSQCNGCFSTSMENTKRRRLCQRSEEAGRFWRKLSVSGVSSYWCVYEEVIISCMMYADAHKRHACGKEGKV